MKRARAASTAAGSRTMPPLPTCAPVTPRVDAPMSAQTRPPGSTPNRSSAGASLRAPLLAYPGSESTSMCASSLTARSGRRTVSPATRTLPARMSACARARDSASPLFVTNTSSRGISGQVRPACACPPWSEDEPDAKTDHGADQHLERRVPQELTQVRLLHAPHVHQVLDEAIQDLGLAPRSAAQAGRVVHHHEREDKGDRERSGSEPRIFTDRGGEGHHDRAVTAGHTARLGEDPEVEPPLTKGGEQELGSLGDRPGHQGREEELHSASNLAVCSARAFKLARRDWASASSRTARWCAATSSSSGDVPSASLPMVASSSARRSSSSRT